MEILYMRRNILNLIIHQYPQIMSLPSHQIDIQILRYLQWPQEKHHWSHECTPKIERFELFSIFQNIYRYKLFAKGKPFVLILNISFSTGFFSLHPVSKKKDFHFQRELHTTSKAGPEKIFHIVIAITTWLSCQLLTLKYGDFIS